LVPAAVAGLVMVAALAGAILVYGLPTMNLTPGTGTTTASQARIRAEEAWMHQRIQQSAAFDVMSSANRQSADRWEAMQRALTVAPAARSSTFTEAERLAILRHQMLVPESVGTTSELDEARKLQIERQVQSGAGWHEFTGQRKGGDATTPTDPKIR
ncbi:MAG TPA: hypothetical protein VFW95_07195, partial [Candidatus Limnocylindria bacterium]|nr:hypothetical protein [Candidatus Limnocylindria bacterium]